MNFPFVDLEDEARLKRALITAALRRIREFEGDGPRLDVSWLDVEAAVDVAVRRMYGNADTGYDIHIPFAEGGILEFRVRPYLND